MVRVLPRVRLRFKRPRPPGWWRLVALCLFDALFAMVLFVAGFWVSATGAVLMCACEWRVLTRWQPDALLPPPMDLTEALLSPIAVALMVAGVFV